jgi:hypothetical protein
MPHSVPVACSFPRCPKTFNALLDWLIAFLQIVPEVTVASMTTPLETLGRKPRRTVIWRSA